ncbi:MAG TPA: hypothetical protein VMM92_01900 [Thermoanaerobaculia bacterium]|nr:hypothetical protein [Thermoanaerobaculia bacterium]
MATNSEIVTVTFTPGNIGSDTPPVTTSVPADGLRIRQGITIIIFNLVTNPPNLGGNQPTFPVPPSSPPIQFADGSPLDSPFSLFAWGDLNEFQVEDANIGFGTAGQYLFTVFVEFEGVTYPGDPMIINEPPVGSDQD